MEKHKLVYENQVNTLDFETTSLVSIDGINWGRFDTSLADVCEDYTKVVYKKGYVYLWGFYRNGEYIQGNSLTELLPCMIQGIKKYETRVIYVHNLSFEFQFLRNIFEDLEVFARKPRKVMKCYSEKYHIEFRCTYMLTGYSLAKCGEIYGGVKMVGDLDYSKIRNRHTKHTKKELNYLKQDCLVCAKIVLSHLEKYGTIAKIPLTSTGKLRNELKEKLSTNDKYKISKMIDTDLDVFSNLVMAFSGGYTHANAMHTCDIIENMQSKDIVSSYPSQMLTKKYPCSKFRKVNNNYFNPSEKYCYLMIVKFSHLRNRGSNSYLSYSKCREMECVKVDNGRIYMAESLVTTITDIDFQIIQENYYCEYEILELYQAKKNYLPNSFLLFIIQNFFIKQSYKGIQGKEEEYQHSKENLNSLYGMCVTNLIRDEVLYDHEEWEVLPISKEDAEQKLQDNTIWYKVTSNYSWGVWVTAYARESLWYMINRIDDDVVYCDTDSVKYMGDYEEVFNTYNKMMEKQVNQTLIRLGVETDLGNIGQYEDDGTYEKFVTMGAKKYCYEHDGKLHITVSGVPKKSVKALKTIEDFKEGFLWNYSNSNKNEICYNDEQEPTTVIDYQGNADTYTDKYGICISPTTYRLGITDDYYNFIMLLRSATSSTRASFLSDINKYL